MVTVIGTFVETCETDFGVILALHTRLGLESSRAKAGLVPALGCQLLAPVGLVPAGDTRVSDVILYWVYSLMKHVKVGHRRRRFGLIGAAQKVGT